MIESPKCFCLVGYFRVGLHRFQILPILQVLTLYPGEKIFLNGFEKILYPGDKLILACPK